MENANRIRINDFAVGTIAGLVAFSVLIIVIGISNDAASHRYWDGYKACVASGGTWVPTRDTLAVCLQK